MLLAFEMQCYRRRLYSGNQVAGSRNEWYSEKTSRPIQRQWTPSERMPRMIDC